MKADAKTRSRAVSRKSVGAVLAALAVACVAALGYRSTATGSDKAPPPLSTSGIPANKTSGLDAADQTRQQAALYPVASVPAIPAESEWAPGILDSPQSFIDKSEFEVLNTWNGPVNGRWEFVSAGGKRAVPSLGDNSPVSAGVYVFTYNSDPNAPGDPQVVGAMFPTPSVEGFAKVTSIQGDVLTVEVPGQTLHFDTVRLRFV